MPCKFTGNLTYSMLYETFIKEYVALYQIFFFVQPCAFANRIAPDTGKDKEIQKFFL